MAAAFDWQALADQLIERSREAILQFATAYPEVTCSFFAYEADPLTGEFLMYFESEEHSLQEAQENEQHAMATRNQMLSHKESWRTAKYFLSRPRVTEYSPDAGLFAYEMDVVLKVRELRELSMSGAYPKGQEGEDDYVEGNVRIVLWKVIERLIASEAFNHLSLATPFRVGYQFHEEELVVLRILNWPQP